jgi:hypothetical protein
MSGYLQRLYDRAAGALPVAAPALRPGSPLARFDQRLAISELAQDFSFGAVPDPPAIEREEVLVPLPRAPHSQPSPGTGKAQPNDVKAAATRPARDQRGPDREGSRARRRKPALKDLEIRPREADGAIETTKDVLAAPKAVSRSTPDTTDPVGKARPPERAPVPSPASLPGTDEAPATRDRQRKAVEPVERLVTPPPKNESEPLPVAPAPRPMPVSTPTPAAGQVAEARKSVPQPAHAEPRIRPLEREAPPAMLPQAASIDWMEVDRRIESALRGLNETGSRRQGAPSALAPSENGQAQEVVAPPGLMTAAQASVIGPIEPSPRHRMLFGARWR